jgi:hypothetical protein
MNDTNELPYPAWQGPLQEVLLEFDREKLSDKALNAETQMHERLQQLRQSRDGHNEREAIDHGLFLLRKIRRDKLGFPDWS